jgi:hypothetical protein
LNRPTPDHTALHISNIKFTAASPDDVATGLVGYVSAVLNSSVKIDCLTLRRAAADGHLLLSYPAKRDATGRQHPIIRPLDDEARREIEAQVFEALGFTSESA